MNSETVVSSTPEKTKEVKMDGSLENSELFAFGIAREGQLGVNRLIPPSTQSADEDDFDNFVESAPNPVNVMEFYRPGHFSGKVAEVACGSSHALLRTQVLRLSPHWTRKRIFLDFFETYFCCSGRRGV